MLQQQVRLRSGSLDEDSFVTERKVSIMNILKAHEADLCAVKKITERTIKAVYPHYYAKGAVEFFLEHHNENNIMRDICSSNIFLYINDEQVVAGTITLKDNEICRLFVLPEYQGKGYGRGLLDFAEKTLFEKYDKIVLDASLPAKAIYMKRGYKTTKSETIQAKYGDFLCYDVMIKIKDTEY